MLRTPTRLYRKTSCRNNSFRGSYEANFNSYAYESPNESFAVVSKTVERRKWQMSTARKMNDAGSVAIPKPDNISLFPSRGVHKQEELSWIFRRLVELGVIVMPNSQHKNEWTINKTNFFGWVGIIVTFCTFAYFIYNKGVEVGRQQQMIEHLTEDVKRAQTTGDKAVQLAVPSAKNAGHENTNTEKK